MCRVHKIVTRFMNQSNHWIRVTDAHHYFNQVVFCPHTRKKRAWNPTTATNQATKGQNVKCAGLSATQTHTHKKKLWHSHWHRSTRSHLFSFRHKIENNSLPKKNHYKNKRSNILKAIWWFFSETLRWENKNRVFSFNRIVPHNDIMAIISKLTNGQMHFEAATAAAIITDRNW